MWCFNFIVQTRHLGASRIGTFSSRFPLCVNPMVIRLVDEWATHFHFEGLTLYFLNYHLTIFQAKWRVHDDDYGKVCLRNLKVHFFHVHFLDQKVHQLKIRHTCTFFAYYYYYYYYYYYTIHKVREIGREPNGPHPKESWIRHQPVHHPLETHYD